jgi:hypothetical protein
MPDINDKDLIASLLRATQAGKLGWESTSTPDRFAASYGGRWTLTVDKSTNDNDDTYFYLTISNAQGEEILRIWGQRDNVLPKLFERARRHALRVDEALGDLIKEIGEDTGEDKGPEISDEDIPF